MARTQTNKFATFYTQANRGREQVEQPQFNTAVKAQQGDVQAQKDKNKQSASEATAIKNQNSLPNLGAAAQASGRNAAQQAGVQFSKGPEAKGPNADFASKFAVNAYSTEDEIDRAAAAQTTDRASIAAQQASAMEQAAATGLQNFYDTNMGVLGKEALRDPTQLAAQNTMQTQQEQFLNLAGENPLSNAALLSQMYLMDPQHRALESQVRQGEINKLRGDAAATLANKKIAEGSALTTKNAFDVNVNDAKKNVDTARSSEEAALKKYIESIRNNPSMTVEAKNRMLETYRGRIDSARNDEVANVTRRIPKQFDRSNLDGAIAETKTLIDKGFSAQELRDRMLKQGIPAGNIDILLNPDLAQNLRNSWQAAEVAKQQKIERQRQEKIEADEAENIRLKEVADRELPRKVLPVLDAYFRMPEQVQAAKTRALGGNEGAVGPLPKTKPNPIIAKIPKGKVKFKWPWE